jgi:hypothetical protein
MTKKIDYKKSSSIKKNKTTYQTRKPEQPKLPYQTRKPC